jgi:purine nucleosidase
MKKIILDTDIGTDVDDAMALSLAALSPEFEILGVTTVHADAPYRARIARKLLDRCGRPDVPVIAGASMPLHMPLPPNFTWMPRLRGHEGVGLLEGAELLPSADPNATADDAARFIIEQAHQYPGEVSLITIGAMTNYGRALQLEPHLGALLNELILMGGTVYAEKFPFPPMLETNLNADPEAASLAFASGVPLTIVPMEVTTQVYLTPQDRAEILSWGTPLAKSLVAMMEAMFAGLETLSAEAGLGEDFYQGRTFMHDPLAIYTALTRRYVTVRRMPVTLEVIDQVVRTMPHFDREPNCWVCVDVDASNFVQFWKDRIHTCK